MVRLEKIRKSNCRIEAEFYPEDSKVPGFISVDLLKGAIADRTDAPGYEEDRGRSYVYHAMYRLLSLAEKDNIPEKCTVMWY